MALWRIWTYVWAAWIAATMATWALAEERTEEVIASHDAHPQVIIDETIQSAHHCLDNNILHPDWVYWLNGMYWRILNECFDNFDLFKAAPMAFNTSVLESELAQLRENNPVFFHILEQDLSLLQDASLVERLRWHRQFRSDEPYDIDADPDGICTVAFCDWERAWDHNWRYFNWVYMIINDEYSTAYNLLWILDRRRIPLDFFIERVSSALWNTN